jgi:hypothetical protein
VLEHIPTRGVRILRAGMVMVLLDVLFSGFPDHVKVLTDAAA